MNYQQYQQLFDDILSSESLPYPYNDEMYLSYTKLNRSRMRRWDKQLVLGGRLVTKLKQIKLPQQWLIITEPWCGDAAHILPFVIQMVAQNDLLTYDIILRDSEPFLIESYLTNGTKSIPKLIIRDKAGEDLFTWGPRPTGAQELLTSLKAAGASFEVIKIALQNWYNQNKGVSLNNEIADLLDNTFYITAE